MRIAKYIANAGICSRRDAEKLVLEKKVKINGSLCIKVGTIVKESDQIKVYEKIIKNNKILRLWKLYKPIKYICTTHDPQNRKTVFNLIPKNYPRLISVGRLDYMSEGLLLFTNNGDLARKLELPSSNYKRIYKLCINGKIKIDELNKINKGITINKILYNKIQTRIEKYSNNYSWLIIKLREGKNREIRNICEYFSWNIVQLIRIKYGPYKLLDLKKGEIKEIKKLLI